MRNMKTVFNIPGFSAISRGSVALLTVCLLLFAGLSPLHAQDENRPNIVFAFADDWGLFASIYGTPGLSTPNFDRLADAGVRFDRAFMDVPSCTPARGAVLTGQNPWRLGPGANLWGELPVRYSVYPDLLEEAGYHIGFSRKGWGPGNVEADGRTRNPAGPEYEDFDTFLAARPGDEPFAYWFGSQDPHRSIRPDAFNLEKGIDPSDVEVPPPFPDVPEIRQDIAEYYAQIQRFDREVGELIARLEADGELENTLFVIGSDHGWPFPRGKSNLYDSGTRVPLAIWWPQRMEEKGSGARVVTDFVMMSDLAPTFLEAAGITPPPEMTGRSLMPILESTRQGRVEGYRSFALLMKERHHGLSREGGTGYPGRAIRTENFLLIRNYEPGRWPLGAPYISSSQEIFSDSDYGLTCSYLIDHADDPGVKPVFLMIFDKRPELELYDLSADPRQLVNVAGHPAYRAVKRELLQIMEANLMALEDPRMFGKGDRFDEYTYHVTYGKERVEIPPQVRRALNLEE